MTRLLKSKYYIIRLTLTSKFCFEINCMVQQTIELIKLGFYKEKLSLSLRKIYGKYTILLSLTLLKVTSQVMEMMTLTIASVCVVGKHAY